MSEQKPCFMCDPSILEQGQRCATGAPICDRHRDQLTGNMRPPTAAELALTARAEAAEQQAARLMLLLCTTQRIIHEENHGGRPADPEHEQLCEMPSCRRIRAALAASQPAPAVETERRQQGEQEADR